MDGCRHEARLEGDISLPKTVSGGSVTQFEQALAPQERRYLLTLQGNIAVCVIIRTLIRGDSGAKVQLRFRVAAITLPPLLLRSEAKSS
jgi:hypothetical protein